VPGLDATIDTELKGDAADTADAPPSELIKRYQLAVKDLDFGMFVAELDRPWIDTPFLLQGFLVEKPVELETIRKHCEYVFVDFELSRPEVSEAIIKADMANAHDFEEIVLGNGPQAFNVETIDDEELPKPVVKSRKDDRIYKARSDLQVSAATRERFKKVVRATAFGTTAAPEKPTGLSRFFGWFKRNKDDASNVNRDSRAIALDGLLEREVRLRNYRNKSKFEAEMPRARATFQRSEEVMTTFLADVKSGKPGQIKEVQGAVIDMVDSMIDNPDALIWIARLRDEDVRTYNHAVKVALYLVAFGRHLGFPKEELAHLGMIGMLADVGKSKLPRALIEKPGMLSQSEFALIKEHVTIGLQAIKKTMTLPPSVEQGIAQHHERLDGSGYPLGLKGDQIGIYGRMTAIADCFAALITPRAYANPAAPQEALMNLFQWAGTSFHEPLIEQFVQAVGIFPIGSLVELSTGEVAVVLSHNRVKRLEPRVLVLANSDKNPLAKPVELDIYRRNQTTTSSTQLEKALTRTSEGAVGKRSKIRIIKGLPAGSYGLKLRDYYMGEVAKASGLS
jgi:HD-GYP domain-containing protein (c-di-GMP phosphodiesterase class II)